ncbi:MAG: hypothetical protein LUC22_02885 [Prevotella sp.]|nr:hypothetical protein [Prevotella sp.]
METTLRSEAARAIYSSYDPAEWIKEFFDEATGGFLVVHRDRIPSSGGERKMKNETEKYNKEHYMAEVFARHGYGIAMLKEVPGKASPDVTINGIPADLKRVKNANNIRNRARYAVKKQSAGLVLFQIDEMSFAVERCLQRLSQRCIHGKYFITGDENVHCF